MFLLLFCFSFRLPPGRTLGREEEAGIRITLRRGRVHCQGRAPGLRGPALQSRLNAQGQAGGSRPAAHWPLPHLEEGSPPAPHRCWLAGWNSEAGGGPHCRFRPPLLCLLNNHQKRPPKQNTLGRGWVWKERQTHASVRAAEGRGGGPAPPSVLEVPAPQGFRVELRLQLPDNVEGRRMA